ncbi:hypothetical protein HHI36_010527 [Cryptolaemus montrouzieri]|uniref:UDP-glucuronosyltransferase n=1 Tax=Cryptolaemus montrouzieri TaxID=559131 RepID=A0ABD2MIZ5_9CUCU
MYFFELFWICSCYLTFSVGYNILAIVPYHGYSHVKFFDPIISELVSRGHNLTVLLHRCLNIESQNYKELLLSYDSHVGTHLFDVETFDWPSWMVVWAGPSFLIAYGISSCQHLLSNSEVQKLMDSSDHFDLILSELFDSECNLGFKFKFKAPLVGLSSNTLMAWYTDRFGQPDNPSYIPNGHLSYSAKMNFFERLGNVLGDIMLKANYYFATQKIQLISEKYFKTKMPSFFDMAKNTSLVLVNSYWALHFPRPNVPAVIEIGGSHILPSKALPKVRNLSPKFQAVPSAVLEY